jgi:hypothetical protein
VLGCALLIAGMIWLAHCNERGRARADVERADNGDNLRWRDVNRGALWPGERDEKIQDGWENLDANGGDLTRRMQRLPGRRV